MKHFFFFCFFLLLCCNMAEAQTYANIPDSSHVLVVYKHPTDDNDTLGNISKDVMEYYQQARGIPAENIVTWVIFFIPMDTLHFVTTAKLL